MSTIPFSIKIIGVSLSRADNLAGDLKEFLQDTHREIQIERVREHRDNQELGSVLAIILGSAAVTAVAKGIQAWLARNQNVSIEIHKKGRLVKASGMKGRDALAFTEMILRDECE